MCRLGCILLKEIGRNVSVNELTSNSLERNTRSLLLQKCLHLHVSTFEGRKLKPPLILTLTEYFKHSIFLQKIRHELSLTYDVTAIVVTP